MNSLKLLELLQLLERLNDCEKVGIMAEIALDKMFNNGYTKTQIKEKQAELREILKLARTELVLIRTEYTSIKMM